MARQSLISIMQMSGQAVTNSTPEQSFLKDLENSIEESAVKNHRPGSKTYKPSGMNCIRQSYYVITGADIDELQPSYCLEGICNSGTDIHVRIQTAVMDMQSNGKDCEWVNVAEYVKEHNLTDLEVVSHTQTETKLYNKKYNISFMCDGIIKYKGTYYILEFKTETARKWTARTDVNPAHRHQAIAYSLSFGINEVIFVYINRDVLDLKSFMFKVTNEMKQTMIDYITDCDGYIERQIVPPKPELAGGRFCQYCNYKTQCHKDK